LIDHGPNKRIGDNTKTDSVCVCVRVYVYFAVIYYRQTTNKWKVTTHQGNVPLDDWWSYDKNIERLLRANETVLYIREHRVIQMHGMYTHTRSIVKAARTTFTYHFSVKSGTYVPLLRTTFL
jgi:hypothetical protein